MPNEIIAQWLNLSQVVVAKSEIIDHPTPRCWEKRQGILVLKKDGTDFPSCSRCGLVLEGSSSWFYREQEVLWLS